MAALRFDRWQKGAMLLAFFSPAVANAHHPFCESAEEIAERIEACPDNILFTQAADRCHSRIEEEVNTVTRALSLRFEANQNRSSSAQNAKEINQAMNLAQTEYQLSRLIWMAKRARRDFYDYATTIILPGNPESEMLLAYDIYDYLAESPCYRENRIALDQQMLWIEQKIQELESTKDRAAQLDASANLRAANLQMVEGMKKLSTTHAKGAGVRSGGKSPRGDSTITGEIRNETLR